MANAYAINFPYNSNTHAFSAIWKLTRVMKAAGWTVVGTSDGTNKRTLTTGTPASNSNDYWGTGADPLTDTYPAFDSTAAWIVMRGPSTIKIEFTSSPGILTRGESITQATSGATGEFVSSVWDSISSTGWAVIMPRTGTFDGTNIITGSLSSQTITPTAVKTYVREVMFAKSSANVTNGTIYYICADSSAESTSLFSYVADAAGCTGSVFPAGGGTGNTFPSIAMCVKGVAGATTHTGFSGYSGNLNVYGQIACVNATPSAGVSADGSFYLAYTSGTNNSNVIALTICDDTVGDIDPYAFMSFGAGFSPASYTNSTSVLSPATVPSLSILYYSSPSYGIFYGYANRGGSLNDKAVCYCVDNMQIFNFYSGVNLRTANFPGTSSSCPLIKWNLELVSARTTEIFTKGKLRWFFLCSLGSTLFDTTDSLRYFTVYTRSAASNSALLIGPLDGSTTPTAS